MTQQTINVGAAPNDGTGDPLRTAFQKCNANFTEVYNKADIASPTFTGDPKAPTPATSDNDTSIATTAFVRTVASEYVPQCGRFGFGNSTQVVFYPYNGDKVKIQGVIYNIPVGGVAGIINNCFLNGVAGQTLVAGTVYLVAVFNNSGALALDFLTNLAHNYDTTAGNVGVETSTSNKSRTVVGMVYTTTGPSFADAVASRFTISWFNRYDLAMRGATTGGATTSASSAVELTGAARCYFVNWGEDSVQASISGAVLSGAPGTPIANIGYDGSALGLPIYNTIGTTGWWGPCVAVEEFHTTEGLLHYITPMGAGSGTNMSFYIAASGKIRG